MRIATGLIGIFFSIVFLFQSCTVTGISGVVGEESTGEAGILGIGIAILMFIASAFAFQLPVVSLFIFGFSTLIAIGGNVAAFPDLQIYAIINGILTLFAGIAYFQQRKEKIKRQEDSEK